MQTTLNKMIHVGKPIELSHDFFDQLDHLYQVAYDEDSNIRKEVHQMLPLSFFLFVFLHIY